MVESTQAEPEIDTNAVSRMLFTYGIETIGKLMKMKVLLIGQRGLGAEIAKNLILAGPKAVTLHDPTMVTIGDLSSNFALEETDVGKKSRAEGCHGFLRELNDTVDVTVAPEFNDADIPNYSVICITENLFGLTRLQEINEKCRAANVGFILSETLGAATYAFVDYNKHTIHDANGENTENFIVSSIEQKENPTVTVHEDHRHTYQDGDFVFFREVEGMTELNDKKGEKPIEIFDCRAFDFKLKLDTSKFSPYVRQGIVEDKKVPKEVQFKSLAEGIKSPAGCTAQGFMEPVDFKLFGRGEQLHIGVYAIHKFRDAEGRYPENVAADLDKVVELAKAVAEEVKTVEAIEEAVIRQVAAYSTCSITALSAMMGGFIAQEIVKFTGKYTPLKQWFFYDVFESIPDGEVDRTPRGCRYDDQIKIYGREAQDKIGKINTFMIGAGALGCEYLKAMALMGLGCDGGSVTVTDNDNIEISNLNRQFLFRKPDVGESKAECAVKKVKSMNPNFNVSHMTSLVAPNTEALFNDKFWESKNFIVNAVDNLKARHYVDSKCVWYEKPLLESGTLGTKANQQMVIPHKTTCYRDSQDPPEKGIPMCTLRNFPSQIEHCIEWGREKFNAFFVDRAQDAISFLKDQKEFVATAHKNGNSGAVREKLQQISDLLDIAKGGDFKSCVQVAKDLFFEMFDHDIRNLVDLYPKDSLDSHGQPFWSGPKRCPDHVTFDSTDPLHIGFVLNCANLIAFTLGVKENRDTKAVAEMANACTSREYKKKKIVVETPEEAKAREERGEAAPEVSTASDDDKPVIDALLVKLESDSKAVNQETLQAADFEKDDDSNFHIDFIDACSNLRARNYRLEECDRMKTKQIAGKIIPAIATTTAMITGSVTTEIIKFCQGWNDITKFKNCFLNLALPTTMYSEPDDVKKKMSTKDYDPIMMSGPTTMIPEGWTCWDKVTVDVGSLTLQGLFDWILANKGVELSMVLCGDLAIYNGYLPKNPHAARLEKKIEDLVKEINPEFDLPESRYYITLTVDGVIKENDAEMEMPIIKYCFKPAP